jgi:DAK2 domain fusion protein YloV
VNHGGSDTPLTQQKWLQCNGQQLRRLAEASLFWLEQYQQLVNDLNVFPVPDGDTGTNMVLTMRTACGRIQDLDDLNVGKVAGELAQGALMGARGNSGVILSQIWRGLAKGLNGLETFNTEDLADAFQEAADTAYSGVMRPVEGTILTVIREGAEEAADAASKSEDLRFMMERVLERCQQALRRTPDLLPVLKQAGVVDAGGQGLVFIMEGMLRYVHGEAADIDLSRPRGEAVVPAQALALPEGGVLENPYDVQFILLGQDLDVIEVRNSIDAMGDSTVVVGDESTIKVHIHVKDPGEPLSYGIGLGEIADVVVENMQMQMEQIVHGVNSGSNQELPEVVVEPEQIGVVAVAAGDGLARVFRSLGVARIIDGGQTNNPSTEEIYQAVQDLPTNKVIILPNNKNIILASEAARDLSPKEVMVVPAKTMPQGISAMLFLNPDGDLLETSSAMEDALGHVATGEITRATRSVSLDGVDVFQGEIIGLADDRLCASGAEMEDVVTQVLAKMEMEEREIVTIYYGQDVPAEQAEAIRQKIESLYPNVETELLMGGQPHYYFILGVE